MNKTQEHVNWIQTEHEKIAGLSARLQERVAVVPRANQTRWIADVTAAFEHFRAHLVRHQALEEEGGYMLGVVELRPALSREVERLAHEHLEIDHIMADIQRQLEDLKPDDNLRIRDACRRIQNLLLYLEHHEHEENLLVVSVFLNDLGTED